MVKNVVQHIVVWLKPNYLTISPMTLQVHILILVHSKSQNLSNGLRSAILAVQTKKASKSRKINLVVLPFSGPMNDMSIFTSVQMIGGIELTNNLVVPLLAKLHQLL